MSNKLESLSREVVADWLNDKTAGKERLIARIAAVLARVYMEGVQQGETNIRTTRPRNGASTRKVSDEA